MSSKPASANSFPKLLPTRLPPTPMNGVCDINICLTACDVFAGIPFFSDKNVDVSPVRMIDAKSNFL